MHEEKQGQATYVTTRFNGELRDITVVAQGTVSQLALCFHKVGKSFSFKHMQKFRTAALHCSLFSPFPYLIRCLLVWISFILKHFLMWPLTIWMEKQCALVMVSVYSALLKREWGKNYNPCLKCQVYVSLFGTGCLENNAVKPKHISLSSSVKLLFAICSILWGLSSLDTMDHP